MADFTAQLLEVHGRNIGKDGMVFALPGLAQRGILLQAIFYLFLCHEFLFFQRTFLLPHNCGEGSPQLWGDFTTVVGKVHRNCGAITIKGIKTTFLLKRTTF